MRRPRRKAPPVGHLLCAAVLGCGIPLAQAAEIWSEDFNAPALRGKGAYGTESQTNVIDTAGVTNWSVSITDALMVEPEDYFIVTNQLFEARDLAGECVWMSKVVDISGYTTVDASVELAEEGELDGTEYIRVYYKLDGGSEALFTQNGDMTDDFTSATASQAGLNGSTLQLVIRVRNLYGTRIHRFDDVRIDEGIADLPPAISLDPPLSGLRIGPGNRVVFDVSAAETDGDIVGLYASGLPPTASYAPVTNTAPVSNRFDWTAGLPGNYTITFHATDKDGTDNATLSVGVAAPPKIWLNELHYDNVGTDTNEGFEVAGRAGIDLSDYEVWLYNGVNGATYSPGTVPLDGTIADESSGYGAVWFGQSPLQNETEGLALVHVGGSVTTVLEFVSYEGDFRAAQGAALGLWSIDIGVQEEDDAPAGLSLQRTGRGSYPADFTWSGPATASPGELNDQQQTLLPPTLMILR